MNLAKAWVHRITRLFNTCHGEGCLRNFELRTADLEAYEETTELIDLTMVGVANARSPREGDAPDSAEACDAIETINARHRRCRQNHPPNLPQYFSIRNRHIFLLGRCWGRLFGNDFCFLGNPVRVQIWTPKTLPQNSVCPPNSKFWGDFWARLQRGSKCPLNPREIIASAMRRIRCALRIRFN